MAENNNFSGALTTIADIYNKNFVTPKDKYELELARTQAQARTADIQNTSNNSSGFSNLFNTQNILIGAGVILGGYFLLKN